MLYRKVDCPHCGNIMSVSNEYETSKCKWCRRLVSVKFKGTGKKAKVEVEPIDFPEEEKANYQNSYQRKSYSNWEDQDIYGDK